MTAKGRQDQFAAYESCRSGCLAHCVQRVSGLRRTADVLSDSGSTSGVSGSGHRLAKAQRR